MTPTPTTPAVITERVEQLELALARIQGYAQHAARKLAAQLKRFNAGESATPWDAQDVGRILCHIATEAAQALEKGGPACPTA